MKPEFFKNNSSILISISLLLLAAFFYSIQGFSGILIRDNAILYYSGREMANDIPPYVNSFIVKGPLSSVFVSAGINLSSILNIDEIITVRIVFFLISIFTVVALYKLGHSVFNSKRAGIWSALSLIAYQIFAWHAAAGPRAKTPLVLFEVLCLYFLTRKKWFLCGLFGALAALVWQPAAVFFLTAIIVSLFHSFAKKDKFKSFLLLISGLIIPYLLIIIYFAAHNALPSFIDGYILFHLKNKARLTAGVFRLGRILLSLHTGYPQMRIPILTGMLFLLYQFIKTLFENRFDLKRTITHPLFSIHLTFILCTAWSLYDYQGPVDFFLLLPYSALGFAKLLDIIVNSAPRQTKVLLTALFSIFLLLLASISAINNSCKNTIKTLQEQKTFAHNLTGSLLSCDNILSIDFAEILVLANRKNCQPYNFVDSGVFQRIAYWNNGGVNGWIEGIKQSSPDLVLLNAHYAKNHFYIKRICNWIENISDKKYIKQQLQTWRQGNRSPIIVYTSISKKQT